MALDSLCPEISPNLRELWLWKDFHHPLVSKALDDQGTSKRPLDEDSDRDGPGPTSKKARGGKRERQKKNATAEIEATTTATARTYHSGSDFDVSVEDEEQAEMGSSADQLVDALVSSQLKLYYAMAREVIDEEFEEEKRCVETMRQANKRRAQKKMDVSLKLTEILGLQKNDE